MARVTSGGAGRLRNRGRRIAAKLEDVSPLLRDIGQGMAANVRVRFARETGPDGRWAPLAPSTARGFVRRGRRSRGLRGAVAARLFRATRGARTRKETTAAIGKVAKETGVKKSRLRAATGERRGTAHILVNTGALMGSVSWRLTGARSVQRHFGQRYGVYHQEGRGRNPERRFFGFGRDDIEMFRRAKRRHSRRVMGAA